MTIETIGTVRRGGHRAISNSELSLFANDSDYYPEGIRADLFDAVQRQEGRHEAISDPL
jgi:hypothetical protein